VTEGAPAKAETTQWVSARWITNARRKSDWFEQHLEKKTESRQLALSGGRQHANHHLSVLFSSLRNSGNCIRKVVCVKVEASNNRGYSRSGNAYRRPNRRSPKFLPISGGSHPGRSGVSKVGTGFRDDRPGARVEFGGPDCCGGRGVRRCDSLSRGIRKPQTA